MSVTDTTITRVEAWTCRVPLSRPIVMGELRYEYREYLVVRLSTAGGLEGVGVGMTRNAPLRELVQGAFAPILLGADALMSDEIRRRIVARNRAMGVRGIFVKALGAVDVALWDLRGHAAGLPVWALIGGARRQVPASVAGCYPAPGVTDADLAAEVRAYAEAGYPIVKVAAGDLAEDTERLDVAGGAAGPATRIAYDAHWAWADLLAVLPIVRGWRRFGLAWLEDSFPSDRMRLAFALRDASGIPLAVGEDVDDRSSIEELIAAGRPDVVRVDATANGGLTEAIAICTIAGAHGLAVSTHIFPEVHVHLGIAFPHVVAVETTEPEREIDLLFRLLRQPLRASGGMFEAPTRPGIGLDVDWDAVSEWAVA